MIGRHIDGEGLAFNYTTTNKDRIDLLDRVFNCRMFGTFNIKVEGLNIFDCEPTITDGVFSFYHVKVATDTDYEYGYCIL